MAVRIYLQGCRTACGQQVSLPLSSCATLLVVSYARASSFHLVFVQSADSNMTKYVSISATDLECLSHEFITETCVPNVVSNVMLPAVEDADAHMVRSGLCVIIRHIVKVAAAALPDQGLIDLLGFRQGSLRMCAEVSGWTKLCEVELPDSIATLLHHITGLLSRRDGDDGQVEVELPSDLVKLETHFNKPPKVHNDDRHRRKELSTLQTDAENVEKRDSVLEYASLKGSHFVLDRAIQQAHGWKKFTVQKNIADHVRADSDQRVLTGGISAEGKDKERLCGIIQSLTYLDINYVHLYSEGVQMTIADLCLFSYFYFLVEAIKFDVSGLEGHLPMVIGWLRHMVTLPRLEVACRLCRFDFDRLKRAVKVVNSGELGKGSIHYSMPAMRDVSQDDMELSRRCRTKYKAIKPEVIEALTKMKTRGIEAEVGQHPRGTQVTLDWSSFPSCVHPREGEVPAKRVERKCQQLENLVTAVMEVAQPGDIIVDFCSGGGHLGIAIAHMLPQCTVYLVENKEESLAKAQHRMASMASSNITLYQCNLDYFVGKFGVGVCLHACGSATDMVLHQCLSSSAAFVICPCCYGSIQRTHLLTYPRSQMYKDRDVTYTEFLTLGHAADQTEFNIALENQGRQCMNLVDSDRAQLAREAGYSVILTSLYPLTCSPKNNLLIGFPPSTPSLS